eukprot:TRINITY_DN2735_c0_g1_i7.p1 TRINITY_DN2735_c0_g1~~TRINITY_DN2735_c0_g1_i7.p1  ORF type:complete len:153 (+),score=32.87 TRINITY_DN2735_c0_g1_i7:66-524(+)
MLGGNTRAPRTVLSGTFINHSSHAVDVVVEYQLPGNSGEFTSEHIRSVAPGASARVPPKNFNNTKGKLLGAHESTNGDDHISSASVQRIVVTNESVSSGGKKKDADAGMIGFHKKRDLGTRTSLSAPFDGVTSPTKTYTFIYSDDGSLRGQA